ncbi:MAG: amino acid ABC transporter permease, partial [Kandleria vitulina]|nr:amino acid ABC transporter permease [Kandleria vitulina]
MNAFIEFLTLDNLTYMLFGLVWSVIYGVIVVLVGTILGIIGAALKISKHKVLQSIGGLYTTVFIGTPMMLQILFFAVA